MKQLSRLSEEKVMFSVIFFLTIFSINLNAKGFLENLFSDKDSDKKGLIVQNTMPEEVFLSNENNNQKKQLKENDFKLDFINTLKIQIFLDQYGFRPGVLDGSMGKQTKNALDNFNKANKLDESDYFSFEDLLMFIENGELFKHIILFKKYTISTKDQKYIGKIPSDIEEKAKSRFLPYESYGEFLAEKFHTTVQTLKKLNPDLNVYILGLNKTLIVPNVEPFDIKKVKSTFYSDGNISNKIILNSKLRQLFVVDQNNTILASYPITTGASKYVKRDKKKSWEIRNIIGMPNYVYDKNVLKKGKVGDTQIILPSGPNNPVGVMWMSLKHTNSNANTHIGIHGTSRPERIGKGHSNGCIRLTNWDVMHLKNLVSPNSSVEWQE